MVLVIPVLKETQVLRHGAGMELDGFHELTMPRVPMRSKASDRVAGWEAREVAENADPSGPSVKVVFYWKRR